MHPCVYVCVCIHRLVWLSIGAMCHLTGRLVSRPRVRRSSNLLTFCASSSARLDLLPCLWVCSRDDCHACPLDRQRQRLCVAAARCCEYQHSWWRLGAVQVQLRLAPTSRLLPLRSLVSFTRGCGVDCSFFPSHC